MACHFGARTLVWRSLFRLRVFLAKYRRQFALGILAFLIARILEGLVPVFLKVGIDRIAAGRVDVMWPVAGIIAAVLVRFFVVSYARITSCPLRWNRHCRRLACR